MVLLQARQPAADRTIALRYSEVGKGPSLNNRFNQPVRILSVGNVACIQDPAMWIGYSGSDP